MEQDIPDYDMDSDDERWLQSQTQKLDLSPLKFEEMMDRLEKSSGQTVITLNEAKALLKEDDDLIIAVFDYWLNKRLTMVSIQFVFLKTYTLPKIRFLLKNHQTWQHSMPNGCINFLKATLVFSFILIQT